MFRENILKIVDFIVFSVLFYFGIQNYIVNPNIFDVVNIIALVYVMIRRPDVNTVTLVLIILIGRVFDSLAFFDFQNSSGYILYSTLFFMNLIAVIVIAFRPVLISKIMPSNKNLAVTHQDMVIGFLFTLQGVFQLIMLLEHMTRTFDVIGLGEFFDVEWWAKNSLFFYNKYEIGQFIFAVAGLVILYFMTFKRSKKTVLEL
jgi:hypothetical protein